MRASPEVETNVHETKHQYSDLISVRNSAEYLMSTNTFLWNRRQFLCHCQFPLDRAVEGAVVNSTSSSQ